MHQTHDILIIGGGASAALTAWNLATRFGRRCTIVDPSDRPAFGLAYATPSLKHLLNVAAKGMSAVADDPDHFLRWMRENVDSKTPGDAFVPRAIYGLYLRHLYCAAAPEHVHTTVTACRRGTGAFHLTFADGREMTARQVVLALGHFAQARLPGISPEADNSGRYHHNAWDNRAYAAIAPGDEVVLIGTGLTTVDVLMRLRESGHRGRITAISRRGLFPARHTSSEPPCACVVKPGETPRTATAYLRTFNRARKAGVTWRAAVDSLRPVTNELWLALPEIEQARFRRHLQRRWDVVRHRMAPHIAEIVDAERATGTLRVLDGHVSALVPTADGLVVTATSRGQSFAIEAAHAINCTGPSLNYRRAASPLLQGLLAAGMLAPGFGGSGLLCTPRGGILDQSRRPVPGLFTIGPARLGILFESIAIPEIRQQAQDLARLLAEATQERKDAA
ncbi:FAD/NAD(P)-binding protein [Nguyenibacter vanlangensis]|uniref:FAD/NAD(P)-binding protein n=1 Tax=Nguyenibacter vanlangensis TaxID=1216886 RepID=A0A7Y7IVY2_9PROT|nr:FAD/NAD(P)-binding protein [Nguyenibacter vanlangensis]NVN11157.1 FAD/NAD(P)-binding protein [Nguyenibacter vanlangensis]